MKKNGALYTLRLSGVGGAGGSNVLSIQCTMLLMIIHVKTQ